MSSLSSRPSLPPPLPPLPLPYQRQGSVESGHHTHTRQAAAGSARGVAGGEGGDDGAKAGNGAPNVGVGWHGANSTNGAV